MSRCTECGAELDDSVDVVIQVDIEKAEALKGGTSKEPICEDCAAKLIEGEVQ
jgi:hypothetical protein